MSSLKPRSVAILLVDDHPTFRAGLKGLLESEGDLEIVAEADNGDAAITLARELSPDVVVMDVSLPNVAGAEATRRIVEGSTVRVLALSMHEEVEFARLMLAAGAAGYALKRSASEELVRAVRVVAEGGSYLDPFLAAKVNPHRPRKGLVDLPVVRLSKREGAVMRLVAKGHTTKEIAEALQINARTIETYKARAMSKLNMRTRADVIRYASASGWFNEP